MLIIQTDHLSKVFKVPRKDPSVAGAVKALFHPRYDAKVAVDGISFAVEPGEIVGYIGVNGAGKSTTIKMLTGILMPTGGQVRVLGRDPHRFLVRPIDPLFHLVADRFCHEGIGKFLIGAGLVAVSTIALGIAWTPLNLLYLVIAIAGGGAVFGALNLITATSAFRIVQSIPVTQTIFNTHEFAKCPLTIYPRTIGIVMTWLIPYGFASFYPASYILGRDVGALARLGPLVAAVLLVIGYRVWLFGLRHYASTGS